MADKLKMGDLYRIDIFTSSSEDRVEMILNSLKYTSTFHFIASNIRISGTLQYYGDPLNLEAGTPIFRGTLI